MSWDITDDWPPEDLEALGCCPLCACADRELMQKDVVDRLFASAPGKWQVYRCLSCRSSYVDPRPTRRSIGRAYTKYFTHADHSEGAQAAKRSGVVDGVKAMMNSYRNTHWGMKLDPAHPWKWLSWCLTLPLHSLIKATMRHLPKRAPHPGAALLDVGCGNGDFLLMARAAGWQVKGIDFDPKAVGVARARGLEVELGGLQQVQAMTDRYDYITCSHLIEHVHDPGQWLLAIHDLLKPGGTLWIQTPNIDSYGYRKFEADWRGLEPPRHLAIFNPGSLESALLAAGFEVRFYPMPAALSFLVHSQSAALARGTPDHEAGYKAGNWFHLWSWQASIRQTLSHQHADFITVLATRKS